MKQNLKSIDHLLRSVEENENQSSGSKCSPKKVDSIKVFISTQVGQVIKINQHNGTFDLISNSDENNENKRELPDIKKKQI